MNARLTMIRYGLVYLVITTLPSIYQGVYGESIGIAGLHYIAFGIGLVAALQINGRYLDIIYKYYKERHGGVGKPEYRLRVSHVCFDAWSNLTSPFSLDVRRRYDSTYRIVYIR